MKNKNTLVEIIFFLSGLVFGIGSLFDLQYQFLSIILSLFLLFRGLNLENEKYQEIDQKLFTEEEIKKRKTSWRNNIIISCIFLGMGLLSGAYANLLHNWNGLFWVLFVSLPLIGFSIISFLHIVSDYFSIRKMHVTNSINLQPENTNLSKKINPILKINIRILIIFLGYIIAVFIIYLINDLKHSFIVNKIYDGLILALLAIIILTIGTFAKTKLKIKNN